MNSLVGETIPFQKHSITVEELISETQTIRYYKARHSDKFFTLKQFKCPEAQDLFLSEVQNYRNVGLHGKLLNLQDSKDFPDYSLILTDYSARNSLSSVLQDEHLSDPQITTLIRDMLVALFHIHQRKLVHLRVHPSSIFVTHDYKFKLGEFASVCHEIDLKNSIHKIPADYRSPEVLDSVDASSLTSAVDLWALGCLLHQVLYHESAFSGPKDHQMRGKTSKTTNHVADYWRLILTRLLDPNPSTRAKVSEIIILINEGYMPKSPFPESTDYIKPANAFGSSTKSWVSFVTDKTDLPPDQTCISKLVGKAWNKPFKIPKVFQGLHKRQIGKEAIILKALYLIHRYITLGPKAVFDVEMGCQLFLAEVEKQWKFSTKPKSGQGAEDFRNVVAMLADLLKMKINFHLHTKTFGDWSDLASADSESHEPLQEFWNFSLRTSNSLMTVTEYLPAIKSCFVAVLVEEQQKIMLELSDITQATGVCLTQKYEELRVETIRILARYKTSYPGSHFVKLFSYSSSISSSSPASTNKSSESSKNNTRVEEKSVSSQKRSSILEVGSSFWIINSEEVKKEKEIGQGSSCIVYRGTYRHTPVAIKVLRANSKSSLKEFEREVEAMLQLKHPNLVLFMGATTCAEMSILTEFCFGDTVFSLLHEKVRVQISPQQQLTMALDTAKGMAFLHASGLLHRDLKSLNLLLTDPVNGPNDRVHVKITDFGISVAYDQDRLMTGQMGTCHWMAPEVLNSEGYDYSADVYSYAIVLWEIFARETPYRGINPAMIPYRVLNLGDRPDISKVKNHMIQAIIIRCWTRIKENRPTFPEIIKLLEEVILE